MLIMPSDNEIAWAAGILEGEGCFSIFKRKDRPNTYNCAIHLEMTDEDIVLRVANIFQKGSIHCRTRKNLTRKPSWCWSVQDKAGVQYVLHFILPYLGERRTQKAKEVLTICK